MLESNLDINDLRLHVGRSALAQSHCFLRKTRCQKTNCHWKSANLSLSLN